MQKLAENTEHQQQQFANNYAFSQVQDLSINVNKLYYKK